MTDTTQRAVRSNSDQDTRTIDCQKAREGTRLMLEAVGEDPDRSGLQDTWHRRVHETQATHLCEAMRGVERATETTTRAVAGEVSEPVVQQFEQAIDRSSRQ